MTDGQSIARCRTEHIGEAAAVDLSVKTANPEEPTTPKTRATKKSSSIHWAVCFRKAWSTQSDVRSIISSMRWALLLLALGLFSCGPAVRRDLTAIPQRQISYNDLCGLQPYFDERIRANARPFRAIDEQSTETQAVENDEHGRPHRLLTGEGRYQVHDRRSRTRLQALLEAEYERIPALELSGRDTHVEVYAQWWSSGLVRRLRPDQEVELRVGERTIRLPSHPCLGEFLFNEQIYALRRNVLDSDATRAREQREATVTTTDASTIADASVTD